MTEPHEEAVRAAAGERGPVGVGFPEVPRAHAERGNRAWASGGRRSTAAVGRAVVADALRVADPVGADAVTRETNWRSGYPAHFRRLVEAGMADGDAARAIAGAGLASVHGRMTWRPPGGGAEVVLSQAVAGWRALGDGT
ncbi:MAG: hypothetical protein ACRCY9_22930, partial [Phycicoccus sp.]